MKSFLYLSLLVTASVVCLAKEEEAIQMNDAGEGSQCDQDENVAKICLACSSLPLKVELSLATCCSSDTAFEFCDACVNDPTSCVQLVDELHELKSYSDAFEDYYDHTDESEDDTQAYDEGDEALYTDDGSLDVERQKRFGTLFMKSPKRYGRLLFGKRSPEKRFGRPYMGTGSYFGKRETDSGEYDGVDDDGGNVFDKRFGYVLGSSYKLGKRDDESIEDQMDKRYGQLMLGQNKWFGKRDTDADDNDGNEDIMDKRYGRLFVGNNGWFGKRSEQNDDDNTMNKRYGRLFVGNKGWFGKRSEQNDDDNTVDKRYGRLFVSNKGWFGKKSEQNDDSDMDKRYGRLFVGNKDWFGKRSDSDDDKTIDKRYGRLFVSGKGWFGKRSEDDKRSKIDKRFGRLFMGRRRGSWFG